MIVNFDNSATTFPKPLKVRRMISYAVNSYGGNASRGGHSLAMRTSEAMFSARETAADFFGAKTENTIFTSNCTHALNMAIFGILKQGDNAVISSMEHNSVSRPVTALALQGKITCNVAQVTENDDETVGNFENAIQKNTKAVIMTAASNVTGQILPFERVAKLCSERNICFILDASQASGIIPIKLENGISIICTAGHKALYGMQGTGILLTDSKFIISPLMYGGTGSNSIRLLQPDFLPDRLESGTGNIVGAMSLKAGIEFVNQYKRENIYKHETRLCNILINELSGISDVIIYRNKNLRYVPIVAFNIKGRTSEETAELLNREGFCLRAGLHCAPLAHRTLGTPDGVVRFSPSVFSRENDVVRLCRTIRKLVVSV